MGRSGGLAQLCLKQLSAFQRKWVKTNDMERMTLPGGAAIILIVAAGDSIALSPESQTAGKCQFERSYRDEAFYEAAFLTAGLADSGLTAVLQESPCCRRPPLPPAPWISAESHLLLLLSRCHQEQVQGQT